MIHLIHKSAHIAHVLFNGSSQTDKPKPSHSSRESAGPQTFRRMDSADFSVIASSNGGLDLGESEAGTRLGETPASSRFYNSYIGFLGGWITVACKF